MKRLLVVLSASVVALLTPAAAQMPPLPNFLSVTVVKARPAAVAEFEYFAKQVQAAALKIGLKNRVDGYQTIQGGSPFEYTFVSLHQSMAELDALPPVPAIIIKAHGETEGREVLRAGQAAIESVDTRIYRYLPDGSIKPKAASDSAYFHIVEVEIDPAMAAQYDAYVRKAKAAGDKSADVPTVFRYQTTLGPGSTYAVALPFDTWAEHAKWPDPIGVLKAAYGDAEAMKLEESRLRAVRHSASWVLARRPDLSRIPSMPSY